MGIDWEGIHRSLEAAAAMEGGRPTEEERRSTLRKRALDLSREQPRDGSGENLDLIGFRLALEAYAIESSFVREVHPLRDFTPLPCTPPFILGVMNLRGQIVSIVDLRVFFGLPPRGLGELNKVIVIHDALMEFGILADSIVGSLTMALADVQPPLSSLTGIGLSYIRGMAKAGMIILDAGKILRDRGITVFEELE